MLKSIIQSGFQGRYVSERLQRGCMHSCIRERPRLGRGKTLTLGPIDESGPWSLD